VSWLLCLIPFAIGSILAVLFWSRATMDTAGMADAMYGGVCALIGVVLTIGLLIGRCMS
jgi:hypothetical protein